MRDALGCLRKEMFGVLQSLSMSATKEEKPLKDANPTSATKLKYVWEASERTRRREVEKA
jgi:hypothetical protein